MTPRLWLHKARIDRELGRASKAEQVRVLKLARVNRALANPDPMLDDAIAAHGLDAVRDALMGDDASSAQPHRFGGIL